MKLVIYSVAQRRPPINEDLYRYEIGDNVVMKVELISALSCYTEPEEMELLSEGCLPELTWYDHDMYMDDFWSFCTVDKGE